MNDDLTRLLMYWCRDYAPVCVFVCKQWKRMFDSDGSILSRINWIHDKYQKSESISKIVSNIDLLQWWANRFCMNHRCSHPQRCLYFVCSLNDVEKIDSFIDHHSLIVDEKTMIDSIKSTKVFSNKTITHLMHRFGQMDQSIKKHLNRWRPNEIVPIESTIDKQKIHTMDNLIKKVFKLNQLNNWMYLIEWIKKDPTLNHFLINNDFNNQQLLMTLFERSLNFDENIICLSELIDYFVGCLSRDLIPKSFSFWCMLLRQNKFAHRLIKFMIVDKNWPFNFYAIDSHLPVFWNNYDRYSSHTIDEFIQLLIIYQRKANKHFVGIMSKTWLIDHFLHPLMDADTVNIHRIHKNLLSSGDAFLIQWLRDNLPHVAIRNGEQIYIGSYTAFSFASIENAAQLDEIEINPNDSLINDDTMRLMEHFCTNETKSLKLRFKIGHLFILKQNVMKWFRHLHQFGKDDQFNKFIKYFLKILCNTYDNYFCSIKQSACSDLFVAVDDKHLDTYHIDWCLSLIDRSESCIKAMAKKIIKLDDVSLFRHFLTKIGPNPELNQRFNDYSIKYNSKRIQSFYKLIQH